MTATLDRSCPNGCYDLTISGEHELRDDADFVDEVATTDLPQTCPHCGAKVS